ncbi:TPA: VPA1267 family protein [Vibrio parahaemolyticus]|uniref:VPA1267 family protein n=1 Tax=Vibrio harveyi group TaxID=717610 RepID=UPI0003FAF7E1|nr:MULTISPECIES: VPA1267 family protein [Vibrio harveyi group]EJG1749311.1 hypothetical protein [Vibrio parahaemolyticus]MBS9898170.1 hypothetical protein [Vibrio alginolyticus]HCH4239622.1 hypothetical protein [Vibrio parahaemolyticus]
MANGQELAKENIEKFEGWRASLTDDDYREMEYRGNLKRSAIAKGCGFAKSVLQQNPAVKKLLGELESDLRVRGVLPPLKEKKSCPDKEPQELDQAQIKRDKQGVHTRRLEQRVVELEAENAELKRKLERFDALSSALADVGRLPR